MTFSAIVMAAGKGTRMHSDLPKPLHRICGRPMLSWVIDALDAVNLESTVIVVGHGRDLVVSSLREDFPGRHFVFAEQLAQRGTGDAAAVGLAELDAYDGGYDDDDHVLIVPGDTPLLQSDTIAALVRAHEGGAAACTMVTAMLDNPTGYGRILRNRSGGVDSIVEERDATAEQRRITEINAGMYCFRRSLLSPGLRLISGDNAQGELYLTDVVGILTESGHPVLPFEADATEISGVNDRAQLGAAAEVIAATILDRFMRSGVTIVQPDSTFIEAAVTIEPDVTILPGSVIEGRTHVGAGATIGPNTRLSDARIGAGALVEASTVRGASIDPGATVGPYEVVSQSHTSNR